MYKEKHKDIEVSKIARRGVFTDMHKLRRIMEKSEDFEGEQYATLPGHVAWGSFSYEKDLRMRQELNWNMITDGFVNAQPTDEFIPVEQAKKELAQQYLLRQVFHDDIEDIWKIRFFDSEESSEETDVYIDSHGMTGLIVIIKW